MDALGFMFLSMLSAGFWVAGAVRPRRQHWVIVTVWIGVPLLCGYFVYAMVMAQPDWTSPHLEAGWPTVGLMVVGIWAGLTPARPEKPKKPDDGSQPSA